MELDNLKDLTPTVKSKMTIFQKIVLGLEIVLAAIGVMGLLFKMQSFPYASEFIILSFASLGFFYALLPIPLFRSKKIGGHLLAHFAGLVLYIALVGVLFKIEAWPYAHEMIIAAGLVIPLLMILLLILLIVNFKDKEKRYFYMRIGLRFLVLLILFTF